MSIEPERQGAARIDGSRAGPEPEMMVVPPGLYTLRAIVLGAAALVGAIGLLVFVQAPDPVVGPAEAAAGLRMGDLVTGEGCGTGCQGRAVAVRELDTLPAGLDAPALDAVTRTGSEAPLAAPPSPTAGRQPEAGTKRGGHEGDEADGSSSGKDNKDNKDDRGEHNDEGDDD